MPKMISFLSLALLMLSSGQAAAHAASDLAWPAEGLSIDAQASMFYRNNAVVRSDQIYRIPGALMGGEALPPPKGLSLDEAFLVPSFRRQDTYGFLKIGRHMGGEELELDHGLVGQQIRPGLAIEAGKMAADLTPFNGQHVLETLFTSRRLVYDALWGGQLNDEGLRIKTSLDGFEAGFELWKGKSFPARQKDTNKSAVDLYARYRVGFKDALLTLGAFAYQSQAELRDDSRYAAGHSHGSTITLDPSYFSGDVATQGAFALFSAPIGQGWSAGAQGEISRMKQDGRLKDATHDASFTSTLIGLWGEASLTYRNDSVGLRSERLKIQNDLYGSGALVLAEKLELKGADRDPYRYSLSYQHRFTELIVSRIEWSKDTTTGDRKELLTAGLVFNGQHYTSRDSKE
jgi:hypothetical protein